MQLPLLLLPFFFTEISFFFSFFQNGLEEGRAWLQQVVCPLPPDPFGGSKEPPEPLGGAW